MGIGRKMIAFVCSSCKIGWFCLLLQKNYQHFSLSHSVGKCRNSKKSLGQLLMFVKEKCSFKICCKVKDYS